MSELAKEAAAFIQGMKKGDILTKVEELLGRELQDYEAVFFKDGKPVVGFKPGVPYYTLQCRVCGNRAFKPTESSECS